MDKRYLHHIWTIIRPIKFWYFLLAVPIFIAIFPFALRNNYMTMTQLRAEVYKADEQNGDVVGALNRLRSYVNGHMNTSLETENGVYPPIQLKHTYERLQLAEKEKAESANSQLYTEAQRHCEALYPNSVSGGPRVPCITQYVKDHGGTPPKQIPDALYKFDFVSPSWSPDLAGWSIVIPIILVILATLRLCLGALIHRLSR